MTIDDLLDVAIQHEMKSQILYRHLSKMVDDPASRDFLDGLVEEERSHERRLNELRAGGSLDLQWKIEDPKIAGEISRAHAIYVTIDEHSTVEDIVQLAIQREQRAAFLFERLAAASPTTSVRSFFLLLAGEERDHERQVLASFAHRDKPNPAIAG